MKKAILSLLVLTLSLMTSPAAFAKKAAKEGDSVKVHYTGKLKDGRIFDSSQNREPLEFILGAGQMIPDFEKAIVGMKKKEKKTITIPAYKAYGVVDESKIFDVKKAQLPPELLQTIKVGDKLNMQTNFGQTVVVTVLEVGEDTVAVDANHSLAGKDLIFDIEVLSFKKPKKDKVQKAKKTKKETTPKS